VTETETETEIQPDIPDDLDFEGLTIRTIEYEPRYTSGDSEGDVIDTAVYDRKIDTEEKFNIKIEYSEMHYSEVDAAVRQSVNANSDDYDIVYNVANRTVPLINAGYYIPVSELTYVDLDKPWWNREYIESVSLNSNSANILFGDLSYNSIERTVAVLFNKDMLSDIKGISDTELYDTVLNGDWTLDEMNAVTADVYSDLNGNGEIDEKDRFAITPRAHNEYERLAYSAGLKFSGRDDEGYPTLEMNNEQTVGLVNKLAGIFFNNENVLGLSPDDSHAHTKKFADGSALFVIDRIYVCGWDEIRAMDADFGIIPTPKYDESVDEYSSTVGPLVMWAGVPITAKELEAISAAVEYMAYIGRQTVTPTYYETALKIKYARDDVSAQMVDIITSNARTDFLSLNTLNGLGEIFKKLYIEKSENFASKYASLEASAITEIEKIKEQ